MEIDLMELGIVNELIDDNGNKLTQLIHDPLIYEVCIEILPKNDTILNYIMNHFQSSIQIHAVNSQLKGNEFEIFVLSFLLNDKFQNKKLFDLSFINENLKKLKNFDKLDKDNKFEWLKNLEFECNSFGTCENFGKSDIEVLIDMKNAILKPENEVLMDMKKSILKPKDKMHPDGKYIFLDLGIKIFHNGKYYFFIICDKISSNDINVSVHKKNILSGDIALFFTNGYLDLKIDEKDDNFPKGSSYEKPDQLKEFFKEFPLDEIGGVIRILFELDDKDTNYPVSDYFIEKIYDYKIDQIIIRITKNNLNTFISNTDEIEKNYYNYFINFLEVCKKRKSIEMKEKEDDEKNKKQKIVENCCGCTNGKCKSCFCSKNN
jgi:hypothetical protein